LAELHQLKRQQLEIGEGGEGGEEEGEKLERGKE
jgi:hypothetical protein